ncbi:MAG: AraC family transcriptional regulator, partial [Hyphomicrobiales bacterium]
EQQGMSIGQVSSAVGYESEAAFSRSFKRMLGVSPGAWRRQVRDEFASA